MQLYVPLMRSFINSIPLKNLLLTVSLILFCIIPSAYSQSYYAQSLKEVHGHNLVVPKLHNVTNNGVDSSHAFLDYYIADSILFGPSTYKGLQGQLLNSAYNYPADTSNIFHTKNYFCVNAISVAFDSIPGTKADTIGISQINAIYVPIIQVNHSGKNDTLQIELTKVNSHGYPNANTYEIDTLVIADAGNSYNIGAGNNFTATIIKWNLGNYQLTGGRFAINVTYHDPSKLDSCWFIYGYGSFKDTCPDQKNNLPLFASPTHFSTVKALPKPFMANSFTLFNQYAGHGFFPDPTGDNIFFPCDTSSPNNETFHPGIDGVNYFQDIHIAADVLFISYTGINTIHPAGLSVGQNYPNPYNNSTVINYSLIKPSEISLKVIDLMGREVFSQSYGNMGPGEHSITLDARNFSLGVYFYAITGSGYTVTKKMVVY